MQQQQEVMSSVRFTDAHYGSSIERKGGGVGGGGENYTFQGQFNEKSCVVPECPRVEAYCGA